MTSGAIFFSVPGAPRGKGRGTPVRRGPHLAIVTGAETEAYQNRIAMAARDAMKALDYRAPLQGPLELRVLIRMAIPGSASRPEKERMRSGIRKPTKKPDADNVVKALKDGCNKVVWNDDVQITFLWVRKVYSDLPGLDVRISPDVFEPRQMAQQEAA